RPWRERIYRRHLRRTLPLSRPHERRQRGALRREGAAGDPRVAGVPRIVSLTPPTSERERLPRRLGGTGRKGDPHLDSEAHQRDADRDIGSKVLATHRAAVARAGGAGRT